MYAVFSFSYSSHTFILMNDNNEINTRNKKLYYFGYGSNIHPCRLKNRAPSARFIGIAQHVGYTLKFNKKSDDGSSKGNIVKSESYCIYGAVYAMTSANKKCLDKAEGPGYKEKPITVICKDKEYCCFTYEAVRQIDNLQPYDWYKCLIVLGAEYVKFPDRYIDTIKKIQSKPDPCNDRREKNKKLVAKIKHCTSD